GLVRAGRPILPHPLRPAKISFQLAPLRPREAPEACKGNIRRVGTPIGLDPPAEIGTPPWTQPIAARQIPQYPQHLLLERSRSLFRRRASLGGVIPAARSHSRLTGRVHRNLDLPVGAIHLFVRRRILDGVLIAQVSRHLVRDPFHLRKLLREE